LEKTEDATDEITQASNGSRRPMQKKGDKEYSVDYQGLNIILSLFKFKCLPIEEFSSPLQTQKRFGFA